MVHPSSSLPVDPTCAWPPRPSHRIFWSLLPANFYCSGAHVNQEYVCLSSSCWNSAMGWVAYGQQTCIARTRCQCG